MGFLSFFSPGVLNSKIGPEPQTLRVLLHLLRSYELVFLAGNPFSESDHGPLAKETHHKKQIVLTCSMSFGEENFQKLKQF